MSTAKFRKKAKDRHVGLGGRIAKINLLVVVSEPLVPYVLHVRPIVKRRFIFTYVMTCVYITMQELAFSQI